MFYVFIIYDIQVNYIPARLIFTRATELRSLWHTLTPLHITQDLKPYQPF